MEAGIGGVGEGEMKKELEELIRIINQSQIYGEHGLVHTSTLEHRKDDIAYFVFKLMRKAHLEELRLTSARSSDNE